MALRKVWIIPLGLVAVLLAVLAGLWLARAQLAAEIAGAYFRQNNIASSIVFDRLGFSGLSGRLALGPSATPDFSVERLEVDFDPMRWVPRVTQVRLMHPVVRATLTEDGKLRFPTLQAWLDRLSGGSGQSRYVSDELVVSLAGLQAFLATPGGALELNGDARLVKNALVSASITAKPASLSWRGYGLRLASAKLTARAVENGYAAEAAVQGTLEGHGLHLEAADAELAAPLVAWTTSSLTVPGLTLHLKAASVASGITAANPVADLAVQNLKVTLGQKPQAQAHLQLQVGADFSPPPLAKQIPLLARDPKLASALTNNLKHLDIRMDAGVAGGQDGISLALQKPLIIGGVAGGQVTLAALNLHGRLDGLSGDLDAALSGPGLPVMTLRVPAFQAGKNGFSGDVALDAKLSFDMLRQGSVRAKGKASYAGGAFGFALSGCAPVLLAAFQPGTLDLARDIKGEMCPQGANTFRMDASGWRFLASVRDTAMFVPLGNAALSGASGTLDFSGQGAAMTGKITIAAVRLDDRNAPARFEPLNANGDVTLKDWTWDGQFTIVDGAPLGTASLHHVMATGEGGVIIKAPNLEFREGKLQPRMLSSLLGSLTQAEGVAKFDGVLNWSPKGIDSHGTLQLQQLDFLTPLGTAHAVSSTIELQSLLPPVTAPGQHIAISKVDWVLPLSGMAADFSFGNGTLKLERASTGISEGNIKLGAVAVDFSKPLQVKSQADIDAISLGPLVAASSLADKVKLEGKVSGNLPFTYGPEGIRIVDGHLRALGPGRITIDPSVWTQGGTLGVNAIQDMAYQAMENLAFDQLSADVNSVAGGRLQVVFHIKGRSDPPKPQRAEIAMADVVNGTALQKHIDLPSGTPIDLTLDTSLNFDQLLQSYAEAWSNALKSAH